MAKDGKIGCWGWLVIIILFSCVVQCINECSSGLHKKQDIIFPEYSTFNNWDNDPRVTFQTFGGSQKDLACLNYEWKSGRMAELYVVIENGNELYDGDDKLVGYIIAEKDGSFRIKGSSTANGHYVGSNGAVVSVRK